MASKLIYFLLLVPTLIYARIEIEIVASQDESSSNVKISGTNLDLISERERSTFGLHDEALKEAVRRYFGRQPDGAFLKSPTPWGDLYSSYGWPEVQRSLTPTAAKILSFSSQPVIVSTQIFHNNSTNTAEFTAKIQQEVENTVASTWEKSGDLTVGQEIEYGFDIEVASAGGKMSFSYTTKWGESTKKSESVTVGSQSGVTISLEPNQSVMAELYATRGVMKIQVDYEARLQGSVAVNYDETYKGHHFWSLDVNGVMNAGGLQKAVPSSEVITLGYYSDARVKITDVETERALFNIPMDLF